MNKRVTMVPKLIGLGLLPLLAGCAWLEPDLVLPKFMVRDQYAAQSVSGTMPFVTPAEAGSWQVAQPRAAEPRGNWWEIYHDPQLNSLMQDALANSPNLQVMAARVKQARAQAGLATSQLFPQIYANGGINRQKLAPADIQQADTATVRPRTTYNVGANASYELDLFGRVAGGARQAKFASLAQQELYESTKLSLQADVVQAYFTVRTSGVVMRDISETLNLAEKNLTMTKRMYELGDIPSQTYQQAVADLMTLRSDALEIQRQRLEAHNRLAVLLGKMPGSVLVSDTGALTELPPLIPAGVPSTLLERRPDVVAAQNQLAAANAKIGVARSAFFPMLSITGNAGYAAQDMSNLFKSSTSTWAIGPTLTLPIFQGSTNLSNLRLSWGQYEEAVAAYQQQVLSAFAEVENALDAHRITLEQASGQQQAAAELEKTLAMAERQYAVGDISQMELLQTRQQTLTTRINTQQALLNAYTASAQLVRALGGGWQPVGQQAAPAAQ